MQKRLVYAVTVTILDRQYSKRKQTEYIYVTSGNTHPVVSKRVMEM
jgi:hypothetical protein